VPCFVLGEISLCGVTLRGEFFEKLGIIEERKSHTIHNM